MKNGIEYINSISRPYTTKLDLETVKTFTKEQLQALSDLDNALADGAFLRGLKHAEDENEYSNFLTKMRKVLYGTEDLAEINKVIRYMESTLNPSSGVC